MQKIEGVFLMKKKFSMGNKNKTEPPPSCGEVEKAK